MYHDILKQLRKFLEDELGVSFNYYSYVCEKDELFGLARISKISPYGATKQTIKPENRHYVIDFNIQLLTAKENKVETEYFLLEKGEKLIKALEKLSIDGVEPTLINNYTSKTIFKGFSIESVNIINTDEILQSQGNQTDGLNTFLFLVESTYIL